MTTKDYFTDIRELVSEAIYTKFGNEAWSFIDSRLRETLNQLKERYGYTMIINTWYMQNRQRFGEKFSQRGYRGTDSTTGKPDGAHYKGMAVDIDFYDKNGQFISANTMRQKIMADIVCFPHIRCLEINVAWVHVDIMSELDSPIKRAGCNNEKVMLVKPDNSYSWHQRPQAA